MKSKTARVVAAQVVLSAALLSGVPSVWAATASTPAGTPEPERELARALFKEGLTLLDAGQYAQALELFERAYAVWNNPKILLNIATAQRALGQLSRAANNYARYQRTAEPEPSRADEVAELLSTLDASLGRLEFTNVDAGQRFWLNDEELLVAPHQDIRVDAGEYMLRIVQPGAPADARPIVVWPGERLRVDATRSKPQKRLEPAAPPDEPEAKNYQLTPDLGSRVRLLARADVDVKRQGAVGALGAAIALRDFLRVTGGALIGARQGGWLGVELLPSRHWLAPVLGLSAPVFLVEGVRPGVSAEVGLRVEATRRLAPFARVAVTHFPNVPSDYVKTALITSLGMEVGL